MNIVFWLIVIVALVLLWFCLSFAFKGIGAFGLRIYNDAKKEISEESEEKSEKTTEELKDEGKSSVISWRKIISPMSLPIATHWTGAGNPFPSPLMLKQKYRAV